MDTILQEATSMQPLNLLDYEALARKRMGHIPWAWEYYQGGHVRPAHERAEHFRQHAHPGCPNGRAWVGSP